MISESTHKIKTHDLLSRKSASTYFGSNDNECVCKRNDEVTTKNNSSNNQQQQQQKNEQYAVCHATTRARIRAETTTGKCSICLRLSHFILLA